MSIPTSSQTTNSTEIRPFHVDIPEEKLTDLRRRIAATQWPEKETVADQSQGVPLATMRDLARYWATDTTGARPKRSSMLCCNTSQC